jgi:hypothetical protein
MCAVACSPEFVIVVTAPCGGWDSTNQSQVPRRHIADMSCLAPVRPQATHLLGMLCCTSHTTQPDAMASMATLCRILQDCFVTCMEQAGAWWMCEPHATRTCQMLCSGQCLTVRMLPGPERCMGSEHHFCVQDRICTCLRSGASPLSNAPSGVIEYTEGIIRVEWCALRKGAKLQDMYMGKGFPPGKPADPQLPGHT